MTGLKDAAETVDRTNAPDPDPDGGRLSEGPAVTPRSGAPIGGPGVGTVPLAAESRAVGPALGRPSAAGRVYRR